MFDAPSYILGKKAGESSAKGLKVLVVEELPTTGQDDILYLVPKQDTETNDIFDEYLYVNSNWEHIGTTDIDLSNYYTKGETIAKLTTMPTASATNLGMIVLYIGTTSGNYTTNRFYRCVSDGESTPTYSWENINVQDSTLPIASSSTLGGIKVGEGLNIDALTGILSTGFIKVVEVNYPLNNSGRYFSSKEIKELSGRGLYLIKNMNQTSSAGSTNFGSVLLWCDPLRYYQVRQTFLFASAGNPAMYAREIDPRNVDDTTEIRGKSLVFSVYNQNTSTRPNASADANRTVNATVEDIARWYGNNKSILDLTTTNKTSLVDAINEVNGKIGNINTVLATLTTPSSNVSL